MGIGNQSESGNQCRSLGDCREDLPKTAGVLVFSSKKTPGGAGTHTEHADAQRHTDESHNQQNPPTTHTPHVTRQRDDRSRGRLNSRKPEADRSPRPTSPVVSPLGLQCNQDAHRLTSRIPLGPRNLSSRSPECIPMVPHVNNTPWYPTCDQSRPGDISRITLPPGWDTRILWLRDSLFTWWFPAA